MRDFIKRIMKGLSLLRGCLDELPKERKATIAGDMGELKRELREKVIMVVIKMLRMINGIDIKVVTWGRVNDAMRMLLIDLLCLSICNFF